VEASRADEGSILHLYRRLLAERRSSPALSLGTLTLLDTPPGTLGWERRHGDDERTVLLNMTAQAAELSFTGHVAVASDGYGEGQPYTAKLGPDTAVVLNNVC
jgi:glycosidase